MHQCQQCQCVVPEGEDFRVDVQLSANNEEHSTLLPRSKSATQSVNEMLSGNASYKTVLGTACFVLVVMFIAGHKHLQDHAYHTVQLHTEPVDIAHPHTDPVATVQIHTDPVGNVNLHAYPVDTAAT